MSNRKRSSDKTRMQLGTYHCITCLGPAVEIVHLPCDWFIAEASVLKHSIALISVLLCFMCLGLTECRILSCDMESTLRVHFTACRRVHTNKQAKFVSCSPEV